MTQTSLDDEDLFGEAASEMRSDVEESLEAARAALPSAEAVWAAEGENVLGVLNGLKAALDAGDAAEHLRDAKKWFTMGQRADAFADEADLAAEIEDLEEILADVEAARDEVGELTTTLPGLKGALEDAASENEAATASAGADD